MAHTAAFLAPYGVLQATAGKSRMPEDVWFTDMVTSPDIESIHLPIDDSHRNLRIVTAKSVKKREILSDSHVKSLVNMSGMLAATQAASSAMTVESTNDPTPEHSAPVRGALIINLDQVSPREVNPIQ